MNALLSDAGGLGRMVAMLAPRTRRHALLPQRMGPAPACRPFVQTVSAVCRAHVGASNVLAYMVRRSLARARRSNCGRAA